MDKNQQKQEQGEQEMTASEEMTGKSQDGPEQQFEDDIAEGQPDKEEKDIEGDQEDSAEQERDEDDGDAALDSTMPEVETLELPEEMDLSDAAGSDESGMTDDVGEVICIDAGEEAQLGPRVST